MFALQPSPVIQELAELERLAPKLFARELQPIIESLRARRKTCYRCATETIGKYRQKRRQRHFCRRECAAAQAKEDFLLRASAVQSVR